MVFIRPRNLKYDCENPVFVKVVVSKNHYL